MQINGNQKAEAKKQSKEVKREFHLLNERVIIKEPNTQSHVIFHRFYVSALCSQRGECCCVLCTCESITFSQTFVGSARGGNVF